MQKKRDEFQNKLISEIEKNDRRPQMKQQKITKKEIRDNITMKKNEEQKKIIKLTPPVKEFY